MNLVELATELEYVPKDQLAQMSQDPSSRYPQYLVLSEIQRRTANEKAYAAARPQPTTTVAEEVVGEFMQPKGLQAGMPSESAPTDAFSSESMGIPASAPMQQPMMMAGGGETKAEAREGISKIMSDINKKRGEAGLSGFMDAAGDVITAGSAVIPINAAGKLRIIEKAMKPLIGSYKKALEASRKGNVEYAQLDPLVKAQASKYIQLNKEADKLDFTTMGGVGTTVGLGIANQTGKFKYQDENKKASGGLTAYANEGQTSLQQSFNDPFSSLPQTGSSIMLPPDLQRQVLSLGIDTTGKSMNQIMAEVQAKGMTITNPPPPPPAPETDINKVLRLSETLDMGSVPNISYTPTEIPTSMTTPVPELPTELKDFKLSQREYNAPTEEDRQRELDVYGLGSLAKAFGTSKNLGEAGAEIGEAAMGISAIKKDQRKEMDRIESLKRADEVQDFNVAGTKYGLESGIRQEQFSLDKAVLDIKQSDNQNEFNANLNLAKYSNELKAGELEMAKGLVNMEILREQVEATNNKTLGSLYNSIRNEISDLEINEFNFDDKGKPKDAKAKRYVELIAQLQGIVGSLQKQGLLQETKPLYQGVN
jgi:hypothetical protein